MTLLRSFLTVMMLLLVGACSDQAPVSGPGTMTVTLKSPNGSEGAALVAILGDDVGSVSASGATEVWSQEGNSITQIVLIDQDGGDLSFRLAVSDTTNPPGWVIHEVAGPDNQLRGTTDYELEFRR
ncbi:MAG: hypothetical protein HN396_00575 [Gemmatimonadales bacterium]|jgi:hypothetical protein|nr:hypothetical protein [Gemmatimonadales bacterium]MDG2239767.1 hypothetical protein [Longimicrobiales bacterium]NCG34338.1 hypothetical protein [Pseudomonadota bacterium]MBT3500471.1 hypothetical protein [Gemmatimonadales bacterium]MBT3774331.1 hypothetical protein [Gemmatimonadales bacterium]